MEHIRHILRVERDNEEATRISDSSTRSKGTHWLSLLLTRDDQDLGTTAVGSWLLSLFSSADRHVCPCCRHWYWVIM
jgi:hypothetical protein